MFIKVKMRNHVIQHGFDQNNKEIEEKVENQEWAEKIIPISRIKSVTEKALLMDYAHGRWIYWEYEGGLASIEMKLKKAGVFL